MGVEKVGEMSILEEASELLIGRAYAEIIKKEKILSIGRPEVVIIKLASGNNLEFKIKTAVIPEVNLKSYLDIAKSKTKEKIPEPEVSEKEIQDILVQIMKGNSGQIMSPQNESPDIDVKMADLNDQFAQSLGFKDLSDLKDKVREDVKRGKIDKEKSKIRMSILEEIIEGSTIDLPQILVESELQNMIGRFKNEIESAGLNFKDYLGKTNSSEDKIMVEWRPQAVKKAKIQLILNKIAEEQNIKAQETLIEAEVDKIIKQYPDADRQRAQIIVETMLLNEAVFEFLENIS